MPKKLTQEEFLAKAVAAHGSRYDYSQVVYLGLKTKVKISCSVHGVFEQAPGHHISGVGCKRCAGCEKSKSQRWTFKQFITAAQAKHGVGTYDYSQAVYSGTDKNVNIKCHIHGIFVQTPHSHVAGKACPGCWEARRGDVTRGTTAQFITAAQAKHGVGTYDYSQVVYTVSTKRVKITCPQHGVFHQAPAHHLYGNGCKKCALEKRAAADQFGWADRGAGRLASLYFVRLFNQVESFYKIGVTFQSVENRFCRKALPGYKYEILAIHKSTNAAAVYNWEQSIIETFAHFQYKPKLYFVGETECFSSADEILSIFPL